MSDLPHSPGRSMIITAHSILVRSLALAGLALMLGACTESGGGADPIAAANTVTVSGTVGGTRIVAMNDNDQIVVEDDTAGRSPSAPGRFPFTLANLPIGSNLRLFFVSNGSLFPFYLGGTGQPRFRDDECGNRPLHARVSSSERHSSTREPQYSSRPDSGYCADDRNNEPIGRGDRSCWTDHRRFLGSEPYDRKSGNFASPFLS